MRRKIPGMNRVLSLILLFVLAVGGYTLWTTRNAERPQPGAATNQDARPLSAAGQAAFLPLVCGGASGGSDGYAHNCTSLPGYPSQDYGGAGTGLGITLTSVIYGHITDATTAQAYVNYQGSFEPHVNNFGGGVLFNKSTTGWALAAWYPGGVLDNCLAVAPDGRIRLLCLLGYTGQGETDTGLYLATIPPPGPNGGGAPSLAPVLRASDLRGTLQPEDNCKLRLTPDQAVLLGIADLRRGGGFATAGITYVPAAQADAACKSRHFAGTAAQTATLSLSLNGAAIVLAPHFNFAPAEGN